jgi:hypothetical protein
LAVKKLFYVEQFRGEQKCQRKEVKEIPGVL